MKKILVIGSINVDFAINVDSIPRPGETVNADSLLISNGGKGANQAFTIGRLNGNVKMLGKIGTDTFGEDAKEALKNANVNVESIVNCNKETGKAFINVDKNGENCISIIHGANYEVDEKFIEENKKIIEEADIILIQLEIPIQSVKKVLELSKNKIVILDPAPANKGIMDFDLRNVYLTKPNETEIEILTGIKVIDEISAENAARILLNKGIKNVIVSLGKQGCLLVNNSKVQKFGIIDTPVVDTTAAGDSFIASICYGLSKEMPIEEAIQLATKVASIVVTKKGAQNSIPTYEEVF